MITMRKRLLFFPLILCLLLMTACSNNREPPSIEGPPTITTPVDIINTPDRIHVVKNTVEVIYEKDTAEYNDLLEKIKARLPDALKEAKMAIPCKDDDGTFDWTALAHEFDYIRLSYDNTLTVIVDCFKDPTHSPQNLSYDNLVFSLSDNWFIAGGRRTYGVLKEWTE